MSEKPSSIAYKDVVRPKKEQLSAGTWSVLLPVLVLAFIILKFFVYIKDHKRHGK